MFSLVEFESRESVFESLSIKSIMDKRMELIMDTGRQFSVLDQDGEVIGGKDLGLLNYAEQVPDSVVLINDKGSLYPVVNLVTARVLAAEHKFAIGKVIGYENGQILVKCIENKI